MNLLRQKQQRKRGFHTGRGITLLVCDLVPDRENSRCLFGETRNAFVRFIRGWVIAHDCDPMTVEAREEVEESVHCLESYPIQVMRYLRALLLSGRIKVVDEADFKVADALSELLNPLQQLSSSSTSHWSVLVSSA